MLRAAPMVALEEGAPGFRRVSDRRAPHNLFVRPAEVLAAGIERGARPLSTAPWAFDDEVPTGGPGACASDAAGCTDPGGEPHGPDVARDTGPGGPTTRPRSSTDATRTVEASTVTGSGRIGAANVVVLATRHYTDGCCDTNGAPYSETDAVGEDVAIVLRDGERFAARWRKTAADAPLELLDATGAPFPLKPGPTWILPAEQPRSSPACEARRVAPFHALPDRSGRARRYARPRPVPRSPWTHLGTPQEPSRERRHLDRFHPRTGSDRVKRGLADMLKGGVIMDVVTPDQARIAEEAGAVAVMALERVPADIRRDGGVARMSDPDMIDGIIDAVSIPVMAKARIGHIVEAQVLQSLGVDYVDESEVLTPADEAHHIDKWRFEVPFVCGATNLGEALRRIAEGAAMIRSKGEAGTGNVVEATRHMRSIAGEVRRLSTMDETELYAAAKEHRAPVDLVREVAEAGPPAGRAVHRRRHRDAGGRRVHDAARRGRRVRRLRHLQVRRPRRSRARHRRGHHPLRGPGRRRQGLARAR